MSRSFFAAAALSLLTVATVVASTPRELIARIGVVESDGDVQILTAPTSTILVRFDLEVEHFEVGAYARYAQRCLGVHAPLVEKSTTRIVDTQIALAPDNNYIAKCDFAANLASEVVDSRVAELPIDLISSDVKAADRAATDAAQEIFWIRQLRSDILSGELGEGFYAGGLDAALAKLDEQEAKLTELFLGRTTVTRESKVFNVALEGDTDSYRVCRFSEAGGIVDVSDVSAELIMLSIKAQSGEPIDLKSPKKIDENKDTIIHFRVAVPSICELHTQESSLSKVTIPLFEFGYNLDYVIPAIKK